MMRLVAAFASLGLLVMTGVARGQDAKKDLDKLQGAWDIIEVVNSGNTIPQDKKGGKVVFKGNEMTAWESSDDKNPRKFRIKLNPRGKPKAIDVTALNGNYKGAVSPAIYQLDGDTLKLCAPNGPDMKERPTEFKSEKESSIVLLTLRRVKP